MYFSQAVERVVEENQEPTPLLPPLSLLPFTRSHRIVRVEMERRSTRISKRLSAPQPTPPSPPHNPSPPLPPASLLSLPTELLEHIVRLSLPEKATRITYHTRQTCLRHLTLVSKRFHVVVQPILEEATKASAVANPKTWNRAVDKLQRDPEPFRFVFLDGTRKKGSWALLDWALEQSSNLRHLHLGDMVGVNLECLAELHCTSSVRLFLFSRN